MPLPSKDNMHLPLLKVVNDAGGNLAMRDAFERVKKFYDQLTPEDIASRLDSGGNRLNNRIQWAKQDLVLTGDLERTSTGIWKMTEKGKKRLDAEWSSWKPVYSKNPPRESKPHLVSDFTTTTVTTNVETDPLEAVEQARRSS